MIFFAGLDLQCRRVGYFNFFCRQWGLCSANTSLQSIGSQGMTSILLHLTLMSLHIMNQCLGVWGWGRYNQAMRPGPSDDDEPASAAVLPATLQPFFFFFTDSHGHCHIIILSLLIANLLGVRQGLPTTHGYSYDYWFTIWLRIFFTVPAGVFLFLFCVWHCALCCSQCQFQN